MTQMILKIVNKLSLASLNKKNGKRGGGWKVIVNEHRFGDFISSFSLHSKIKHLRERFIRISNALNFVVLQRGFFKGAFTRQT